MPSVLQPWVNDLSLMQQSVLITAVRGPDGLRKDHVAKVLCRWLRRSFLISAFEKAALLDPYQRGGGSFTGPCNWLNKLGAPSLEAAFDEYLRCVDEIPHHFQLHLMHAAEILGYKHPDSEVRDWWHRCYCRIVNDAHLVIESEEAMDKRLGDNEKNWRSAEEVVAH